MADSSTGSAVGYRDDAVIAALLRERETHVVGRQVRQIVRLVDDLMEVSRITRGKIDLRLEQVPAAEIIHSAVETSQLGIDRAGQQLVVSLPQEPLELMA